MIPLCDQTVTVYRRETGGVRRFVVKNCFYRHSLEQQDSNGGKRQKRNVLLIVPPHGFVPKIGDRVLPGIGPGAVDWEQFLPVTTDGLGEITYVTPRYMADTLHHYEAGAGNLR